ncbi:hypothetical protein CAEBREN_13266 [Caenorhabditis brenneri]|uniref:Uncharacterized protein n=1 Tax=Caenorhabditis brenneri TaxID=135651 RepID=G0NV15_CAEBE|nr:hypothetical protein CAEBREN_13266 [Caenorhabditis brenneri]
MPASPEDDIGGTDGQAEPHGAKVHKPIAIWCCVGIPSPAHFHNSMAANDPHICTENNPSSQWPHLGSVLRPTSTLSSCEGSSWSVYQKMYAEWNLAVNGVLKRFSNEAFMTWKHNKTQEFYQWEELKRVVDMFVLEQI